MSDSVWIGLMSGTSADGIDAVLVGFDPCIRVLRTHTSHYAADLRTRLLELAQSDVLLSLDELGYLDHSVARCFAEAAAPLVTWSREQGLDLRAIGSHGQTVRHRPAGPTPFTLQLGDPSLIAERCGCTVVADFRRRDVAAGGQGAPLLPALHASAFHSPDEDRAVLNLGGIANLTLLPVIGPVRGFDTGPANALLDAWCQHALGAAFDHDGALAAAGNADPGLLAACLDDPWFALPPPKSTGREQFHLDWLRARGPRLNLCTPADVQATLIELTAHTVADALLREQPSTRRVLVCGGGVRNPVLMAALQRRLPRQVLESTAAHGLDPDWVEAVGFAWLARQTLDAAAGNIPSVTGARGPRILGGIYPGPLLASRTR